MKPLCDDHTIFYLENIACTIEAVVSGKASMVKKDVFFGHRHPPQRLAHCINLVIFLFAMVTGQENLADLSHFVQLRRRRNAIFKHMRQPTIAINTRTGYDSRVSYRNARGGCMDVTVILCNGANHRVA